MDGHHRYGGCAAPEQLLIFDFHFGGCGVGESDHEDTVRIDAGFDHVMDPADKRGRLARTGTGDQNNRSFQGLYRLFLRFIGL